MEWIKKEPLAFVVALLVVGFGTREYFREPVVVQNPRPQDPPPQRLIIETTGVAATTDPDGTIRVKVESPTAVVTAEPEPVAISEPKQQEPELPAVSEVPPVTVPATTMEPQIVTPESGDAVTNAVGSNTVGGFGEAPVKKKTTTEELVPEEASRLAASALEKLPPVLRGLRESGRLNWKIGELEDDVLILDWKQEKFILEVGDDVLSYLSEVEGMRDEIADRALGALNAEIYQYMLSRLRKGEVVHPQLRLKFMGIIQKLSIPALSSFYSIDEINEQTHPIWQSRVRLVGMNLRRSDLFFMIAAYRLANEDYANVLNLEAEVDEILSYIDLKSFCAKGPHMIQYTDLEGVQRQFRSEGQIYLPRLHQKDFQRMFTGENPTDFISSREAPQDRDTKREQREELGKKIDGIVEILGQEWAQYDFPVATISGEDVYYRQKVLLEELESQTVTGDLKVFRDFMDRLSFAKSIDDAKKIAAEVLSEKDATHVANYIISSSPNLYNGPYTGPENKFRVEDLTQSLRDVYRSLSGSGIRRLFSEPPPAKLEKAVQLVCQGEQLAAEGDVQAAVKNFKEATAVTRLSKNRLEHFADYCQKNGMKDDAEAFSTMASSADSR